MPKIAVRKRVGSMKLNASEHIIIVVYTYLAQLNLDLK